MIILTQTTDLIEIDLANDVATNQLACFASFRDITTTAYTPNRQSTTSNNTAAVAIVSAPAASTTRVIDFLSVYNADTASATVTIQFNDNGTTRVLTRVTLAPQERLEYRDAGGFSVIASTGAVKQSINQGANAPNPTGMSAVVLDSDITNNNAVANTIQDVTGLSFAVTANALYYFKFVIRYTAAATTTGSRWAVSCTAGTAANLSLTSEYSLTATTTTRNALIQAFDSPAAANATSASTGNNMAILEGFFIPTANGTFIARFASEVASSAIVAKAGSVVYYQKLT